MALTKLVKVDLVTADAFTGVFGVVNATNITDIVATGATCIWSGTGYTVTCTFDGTDNAEKLLNAQKISDYLGKTIMQLQQGLQREVFDLITTIADFHSVTGIVKTGETNTALVTTALA